MQGCAAGELASLVNVIERQWQRIIGWLVEPFDEIFDHALAGNVDEISYKKRHYLTVISDHDTSSVVHITPGRSGKSLTEFFETLGPQRCQQINAITMDMATMWQPPCAAHIPDAVICLDPFHIMSWVNKALDAVYLKHRNPYTNRRKWQRARTSLRTAAETLTPDRQQLVTDLATIHKDIGHAWTLKEDFRALYREIEPIQDYLRDWITRAQHSNITQFINRARRINKHFDGILAAIEHNLANALAENINARNRLINKRGYGHHSPQTLTTMIYLCLGGITINLPTLVGFDPAAGRERRQTHEPSDICGTNRRNDLVRTIGWFVEPCALVRQVRAPMPEPTTVA